MRLLNTASIEVEDFAAKVPPEYAILSHRWDEKEVTFGDMKPGGMRDPQGMIKIHYSCVVAARHGFKYIWIDTCCIDKTSSAELSEAINSMFRYYKEATLCYAYLSDVSSSTIEAALDPETSEFEQSAWFTRGWTLQELIAPKELRFYNKNWTYLGSKDRLKHAIRSITKIPVSILLGGDIDVEPGGKLLFQRTSRTAFS
ncbi:hypothetical protein ACEPPN_015545 [Leptodophora sp. 'Broadleaf-Isolate-01']